MFGDSNQLYKYRITKTTDGEVMIGFCHLKEALEEKYTDNYGEGRGGYVLYGRNGIIYSHVEQEPSIGDN